MTDRSPQFHFVLALKARAVARDWDLTCRLLADTLTSLSAQIAASDRLSIRVVGHDRPTLPAALDARMTFLPAPFAAPGQDDPIEAKRRDFTLKHAVGLLDLADRPDDYAMFVDADDWVHCDVAEWVLTTRPAHGAMVETGCFYAQSAHRIWEITGFNRLCGSCGIFRIGAFALPPLDRLVTCTTRDQLGQMALPLARHADWAARAAEAGMPLDPLPFAAAAYRMQTGDNNHGSLKLRWRHRLPALFPRFSDKRRTWTHRPVTETLAQYGIDAGRLT